MTSIYYHNWKSSFISVKRNVYIDFEWRRRKNNKSTKFKLLNLKAYLLLSSFVEINWTFLNREFEIGVKQFFHVFMIHGSHVWENDLNQLTPLRTVKMKAKVPKSVATPHIFGLSSTFFWCVEFHFWFSSKPNQFKINWTYREFGLGEIKLQFFYGRSWRNCVNTKICLQIMFMRKWFHFSVISATKRQTFTRSLKPKWKRNFFLFNFFQPKIHEIFFKNIVNKTSILTTFVSMEMSIQNNDH